MWESMIQNFRRGNLMDHKLEEARGRYMKPKFYKVVTSDSTINARVYNLLL